MKMCMNRVCDGYMTCKHDDDEPKIKPHHINQIVTCSCCSSSVSPQPPVLSEVADEPYSFMECVLTWTRDSCCYLAMFLSLLIVLLHLAAHIILVHSAGTTTTLYTFSFVFSFMLSYPKLKHVIC